VCSLGIEEMGVPAHSLVGAVFLFDGNTLKAVATRRFTNIDFDKVIPGKSGIVGKALTEAEIAVTDNPKQDPELRTFVAFQSCLTAACIPLRFGFQIFGAIVIGSDTAVKFDSAQFDLFSGVADQAVIALQNAQLYQNLEAEKQRIIEADEEARKELARDLHDGPTQSIAAIAMRINFIRSLLARDPQQALGELEKVEELAKQTSKDIRGMLFTLRPLVLETHGLSAAVETVLNRIRESDGLNLELVGGENGRLLNEAAQSVVFSIVEEALGNARKYSKAKLIQVRFWQEDDLFVAMVKDDGVGFDTQDVNQDYSSRGSLGMVNMRERAERIDGSLRLESTPGKGTQVTLIVPLDKHGSQVRL
ncbi:MAG: GAF domain-containing sensor histidine kinase, partial [Anaerolineales bacterium]|nr:GAF domain-containing sensor histidine kinase [Anaerolineales bacterium]